MEERPRIPNSEAVTIGGATSSTSTGMGAARAANLDAILQIDTVLGGRYKILEMLGLGGMGAVYKASDLELDRLIALKVIRPDIARHPEALGRFRQELLTARQVTHKNVVRIFDIGESDGVKFITMEYVAGRDLRSILADQGKLAVSEALPIVRQICSALEAAHTEGVIHRDLKPGNVMRDEQGRIVVMDFGLARSLGDTGKMTQTGALLGTVEYMSPEQAMGSKLDARSDLYTIGLIFYELLTGNTPYRAESVLASLVKRTQERATPVIEVDATIPRAVSDLVAKCLERDPAQRFQSAQEIIERIDEFEGKRPQPFRVPSLPHWVRDARLKWIGLAVLVMAVAGVSFAIWRRAGAHRVPSAVSTPSAPLVSLAILPFRNASGDGSLDWLGSSLADMLSTDVGQSASLRTVSPNRLHQIFSDLKISSSSVLDPPTIRRVADFSTADHVVWGQYARFGDQIRIDATLQDLKNDRTIPLKVDVASEKEIPAAIDKLAESIRQNLALSRDVLKALKASSFQPVSSSIEALRDYNEGVGLQRDGKNLEAQKRFEAATKADPGFALAFSKLAQTYSSLGYDGEAEQSAQKAVMLSQDLPESEKYLISAVRSQVTKKYPEAIKAYETLAQASPDNSDVQSALASLYKDSGNLQKARDYYQKLLSANPKDISATLELGRVAIKSGDPQGGLDPLNRAYSLSVQVDNAEQQAASLHFMAVAYGMLSKPEESLRSEEQALAIWRRIGQKRGLALSLNQMASVRASLGKFQEALGNYQEALALRREIGDKRGLGDTLIDLGNFYDDRGDHDQALKMYKEALQLERDLGNESLQAICLNNIGTAYSEKGQFEDSLTYYQQALQLREKSKVPQDIVEAVHNLGETSAEMGQYDQAVSYYLRALDLRRSMDDRRGAAIESYSLGTLFAYQGRFGAALNSKQEAFKTFAEIKDRTSWMAKVQGGLAEALILAGRADEKKNYLEEALSLSRELKNDGQVAEALGFQGDALFYNGDFKSASALYAQAQQAAAKSKEPDGILIAKVNVARAQVQEKRSREAIATLRQLVQQANDLGLKYTSVESSVIMADAMIQGHDYSHARQELERAMQISEKLGMQPLSTRAHYLLATMARDSGNGDEARQNYREALRLLEAMKKDPGAEKLLQRADFKTIYDESMRGSQASRN